MADIQRVKLKNYQKQGINSLKYSFFKTVLTFIKWIERMKFSDFVFEHQQTSYRNINLICLVRTLIGEESQLFTVLTDLRDKNPKSSVTNSLLIENIDGVF